jgi:glycosyltransferase involved in cell wall biosynthesis
MKIIHLLHSLDRISFGIYNAAIFASRYLHSKHSVQSHAFICSDQSIVVDLPAVNIVYLGQNALDEKHIDGVLATNDLAPADSVVVSHGCWLMPTRLGSVLAKRGFKWLYVPHGMLEPWSMQQRFIKKSIYFLLVEKRCAVRADAIRAVSRQEQVNLSRRFGRRVDLVENGVKARAYPAKPSGTIENFLFLGRLHHKKGITPLVKAWKAVAGNHPGKRLIIAGPDQGELSRINPYIGGNIEYVGPLYGDAKDELLNSSHYFVLPSFSEGFPVSVLEGMSFGLIPLISSGCNFDEVFENGLGFRMEPDEAAIGNVLKEVINSSYDHDLSKKNWQYINDYYSEPVIGERLLTLYQNVLGDA